MSCRALLGVVAWCGALLLAHHPAGVAGAAATRLPVSQLSAKFRNWTYYNGTFEGFVVPPTAGGFAGQTLTDTAIVFEKTPEDTMPGRYRMTYLFFNGTAGGYGYETALATSNDLLHWSFGHGGDAGLVFPRNPVPGTFDYGGVTFGGLHFSSSRLAGPRTLKKVNGKYHVLYGCYPSRAGYEAGDGGQGLAWSDDGVVWERANAQVPLLSGASASLAPWESHVVYQPFLLEVENADPAVGSTFWNFYNAAGVNEYGANAEESGVANLFPGPHGASVFPGLTSDPNATSQWERNPLSPVVPSGPPGAPDTAMASDPKVFWDADQGVWVMFYFGLGDSTSGHADILVAFSRDLLTWDKDPVPLYRAGGHPAGIDAQDAHKVSIIYDDAGVGYMYYTAVGPAGRGIALLTSRPVS